MQINTEVTSYATAQQHKGDLKFTSSLAFSKLELYMKNIERQIKTNYSLITIYKYLYMNSGSASGLWLQQTHWPMQSCLTPCLCLQRAKSLSDDSRWVLRVTIH